MRAVLVVDRPLTAAAAENAAKTRTARLGAAMVDGCAASPRAQPRAFVPYFTVDRAGTRYGPSRDLVIASIQTSAACVSA
jgi:hypothetical protein